jgi:hypothetical protein
MGFGPYDNGYLILGFTSGHLLFVEPSNLTKLFQIELTSTIPSPVVSICMEPTAQIFTVTENGLVFGLSLDPRKYHYQYFEVPSTELEDRVYCTTRI